MDASANTTLTATMAVSPCSLTRWVAVAGTRPRPSGAGEDGLRDAGRHRTVEKERVGLHLNEQQQVFDVVPELDHQGDRHQVRAWPVKPGRNRINPTSMTRAYP